MPQMPPAERPRLLAGTQDIAYHPLFKGMLSRWLWRFITHRMTPAAHWFFWPSLVLLFFGSMSLELQPYVLFLYVGALWLLALCVALCTPPRVRLEARHAERVCAGEVLPVEVVVEQQGRLPAVDLQVLPALLPPGLAPMPPGRAALPALRPGARAHAWLGLYAARRGVYALKGYRVQTDFPFGLFNAYRFLPVPGPLLVYPRFTPLSALALPPGYREQPGGVALKARLGDSFELLGNREYRETDNIRNIDWRATARLRVPVVREYTQEYFMRAGVVLDTCVQSARPEDGDNFERAVSVCAAVSDYMARQQYLVDIFAAGEHLYHLTAGQQLTYLDQILDILACVEADAREPFGTLEPEIGPLLGRITLVICVLLDWNPARQRFVEHLLMHGAAVKVVVVRDAPCSLDPHAAAWPGGLPVITRAEYEAGVEML